jgi:3-oxoacyl-[acyl-carrier protein] reductase
MENSMSASLLNGKIAVVFGAGGSIGAAVAKEFSAQGAQVFVAGRTKMSIEVVAQEIVSHGGEARTALIDVLDDAGVNQFMDGVVKQAGKIDIVIDAAGPRAKEYGNGKLAVELPIDEFMVPLTMMVRSRFITARAAARHMISQKSGVIIFVTGSPARPHVPGATAIGAAFGAMENLAANLAFELGPSGVRVVCLRTTANIDSRSIRDTQEILARRLNITHEQATAQIAQLNFLKIPATVTDTAYAAVMIASDRARMLTGTVVNASAGAALD